eukprot:TRINITY_DN9392_c0_g1_i1.p2 TRINITY_DN9392_c0_g1~~TRINITY_DN9392_c0_g1_i1.p2  ORF type:complete len:102 (-),score=33.81 TRINITY_DN9392_c0_g1_i1:110-415(-)
MQYVVDQGKGEWVDPRRRDKCTVLWLPLAGWADAIRAWATETGHTSTVCTLYELTDGDTGRGAPFEGMPRPLMVRALQLLERRGQAALLTHEGDVEGVKLL